MSRNKLAIIGVFVLILITTAFCVGTLYPQSGRSEEYGTSIKGLVPSTRQDIMNPTTEKQPELQQERMVVHNAYVSLETKEIKDVLAKVRVLAEGYGGYVAGSSQKEGKAQVTIRVPKDNFQAAVQEIESYGKVLDERTTSEDVTERYIDLKARLENLKKQEQRLREILGMARTVEEVLKVEKELERVRGQIESLQGQINYIERNIAMSIIVVNLTEPLPPFTTPDMNWREVFEAALRGLFWVLRGLIVLVVSLLPLTIIGVPAYLVYQREKKKRITKPS